MPGILPAPATRVNGCGKGFGYRSAPPRPLASRRSDAPPSLVAALLSPDDAAPLPLAPSTVRQMRGQRLGQIRGHIRLGDDRVAAGGQCRGPLVGHDAAG